ncbi:MAG TPA: hypothetical protein VHK47_02035 [Polyangia bacterium]|nr:hypothetical protein [Polyangia bacterium]
MTKASQCNKMHCMISRSDRDRQGRAPRMVNFEAAPQDAQLVIRAPEALIKAIDEHARRKSAELNVPLKRSDAARMLILDGLRAFQGERFRAWVLRAPTRDALRDVQDRRNHFTLVELRQLSATDRVFALLDGSEAPVRDLEPYTWYRDEAAWRFVLAGSAWPWKIISTVYAQQSRCVQITLRCELPELQP